MCSSWFTCNLLCRVCVLRGNTNRYFSIASAELNRDSAFNKWYTQHLQLEISGFIRDNAFPRKIRGSDTKSSCLRGQKNITSGSVHLADQFGFIATRYRGSVSCIRYANTIYDRSSRVGHKSCGVITSSWPGRCSSLDHNFHVREGRVFLKYLQRRSNKIYWKY